MLKKKKKESFQMLKLTIRSVFWQQRLVREKLLTEEFE